MASNDAKAAAAEGGKKEKDYSGSKSLTSPKGGGMCLCSPTTHQGSFRCRYHRSQSTAWMRRSNSMPASAKPSSPLVISKN